MADLTNAQKKEWAKTLYLKENLTQQEIADRVGVSRVSVSNWVRAGKWEEQKVGLTLTRQEQVANLYRQVAEINKAIAERPEGERFPSSKEADILGETVGGHTQHGAGSGHCRHHQCPHRAHRLGTGGRPRKGKGNYTPGRCVH